MYGNTYKGNFKPKNPGKYKGNVNMITYRSRWELKFMDWCDRTPAILEWGSEELVVPYISPVDNKYHRYFPDFLIKKRGKDGAVGVILIEIKPLVQTKPPVKKMKINKTYLREVFTFGVNCAKWEAATKFCEKQGWKFHIITEKELNIK